MLTESERWRPVWKRYVVESVKTQPKVGFTSAKLTWFWRSYTSVMTSLLASFISVTLHAKIQVPASAHSRWGCVICRPDLTAAADAADAPLLSLALPSGLYDADNPRYWVSVSSFGCGAHYDHRPTWRLQRTNIFFLSCSAARRLSVHHIYGETRICVSPLIVDNTSFVADIANFANCTPGNYSQKLRVLCPEPADCRTQQGNIQKICDFAQDDVTHCDNFTCIVIQIIRCMAAIATVLG